MGHIQNDILPTVVQDLHHISQNRLLELDVEHNLNKVNKRTIINEKYAWPAWKSSGRFELFRN